MKVKKTVFLGVLLAVFFMLSVCSAEPLQPCHKVTNTVRTTTQSNKSQIRLWHAETAVPAVTEEINGLAEAWAAELGPELPKAGNNGKKNSRLDVEIRYSRTGLHWMSFLVQARTAYHQKLTGQRFATRTYDMETGERILLSDLFDENDEIWEMLGGRVRQTLKDYWPDEEPDAAKLDSLCERQALEQADYTLHGMSLVLHYPAEDLYKDRYTLMDVTFFYPEIREWMTEKAMTRATGC